MCKRPQQACIVTNVLNRLQADHLVELAERRGLMGQLAKINKTEVNVCDAQCSGTAPSVFLLALRERARDDLVPHACGIDAESAIAAPRVKRRHMSFT
jgi:hypothetical protein